MKARLDGFGEIPLPSPSEDPGKKWFVDWVLNTPQVLGRHFRAGEIALRSVEPYTPGFSVLELFGGIGMQSLVIQEIFTPVVHRVQEISPVAVEHLTDLLPAAIDVRQADAFHPDAVGDFDLVAADFGDLTVRWTLEGERHRAVLDRIFATEPEAVVLTDIAGPFLHLQRRGYEKILGEGTCGSYESYLTAFSSRLQDLYGYALAGGGYHRGTAVLGLVPQDVLGTPQGLEKVVSHRLEIVR